MTKKKRKRNVNSTKQKEQLARGEKINIAEEGLRLSWVTFIDEYLANGGSGTEAYMVAYPGTTRSAANTGASRLLAKENIKEELNNKLNSQRCTDDWVRNKLMGLVDLHYFGKGAIVSEKALETLARIKGMLTEVHKHVFDGSNPAVFVSPITKEEKEKMDEESDVSRRITE